MYVGSGGSFCAYRVAGGWVRESDSVHGVTTGTCVWTVCCVGEGEVVVGVGMLGLKGRFGSKYV